VFLAADVGGTPRSRADSAHEGKGAPFVQSGGSSPQIGTPPRRVGVAPPTVGLSNEGWPANRTMQPSNQEANGQGRNPSHLTRGIVIGAFCLAGWVCLAWCRLIHGSFFGLDRLSPRRLSPRPPSCWLASVALSLVPGAWCCVEAVGSSPATGQARPDRTRRTGASADSCPQLAFPPELKGQIKAAATISFGCVRVCLWAQSISNNCLSALYITCIPS